MMTLKIYFLLVLSSNYVYEIFSGSGDDWNYEDYGQFPRQSNRYAYGLSYIGPFTWCETETDGIGKKQVGRDFTVRYF